MERAKLICVRKEDEHEDDLKQLIKPCADFMMDGIGPQSALINDDDQSNPHSTTKNLSMAKAPGFLTKNSLKAC